MEGIFMEKTIVTCPHCKTRTIIDGGLKKEIGNPFSECFFCHGKIMRPNVAEWNTMSVLGKFFFLFQRSWLIPFIIWIFLIMIFSGHIENLGWLFFLIGFILLGIAMIIVYYSPTIQDAILFSNRRLKNKEYCKLLESKGYKIYKQKQTLIEKQELKLITDINSYKSFLFRGAVELTVEHFCTDNLSEDLFFDYLNTLNNYIISKKSFEKINISDKQNKTTTGTIGKMKYIRIVWARHFHYDSEIICIYDANKQFYFVIDNKKSIHQMYSSSLLKGVDTLQKKFKYDGEYVLNNLQKILELRCVSFGQSTEKDNEQRDKINYYLLKQINNTKKVETL